jgi:hypothetical protein
MDKLVIKRGLTRYSSPDWAVRLFLAAPGHVLSRSSAPELLHGGIFLPFGTKAAGPTIVGRHLPLFGEVCDLPHAPAGALFLTASHDELEVSDYHGISTRLFGTCETDCGGISTIHKAPCCEEAFRAVMADAFHGEARAG